MKYNIRKEKKYQPVVITRSLLFLSIFILIFIFVSKAAWNAHREKGQSEVAVRNAEKELATLKERHEFLREEIDDLSTVEGREAKLREKFGVGYPGEQVAIIIESENNNRTEPGLPFWSRISNFFKNLFKR